MREIATQTAERLRSQIPDFTKRSRCSCGAMAVQACRSSGQLLWFCDQHKPGKRTDARTHDRLLARRRFERVTGE